MTTPSPAPLRLAAFDDFRALFEGVPAEYLDVSDLVGRATKVGRVLIQGQAGVGKTHLVGELDALLRDRGQEPVSVKLPFSSELLSASEDSDDALTASLLALYGERLGHSTTFIFDDLDSLIPSAADRVLRVVEELTSIHPEWSAIIADRIERRNIRENRWLLAGWLDANDSPSLSWADLPFYRNIRGSSFSEPDDAIESVFRAAGLDPSAMETLAGAVFDGRSNRGGDVVDRNDIGEALADLLERSGLMSSTATQELIFHHALFADYLVGRLLSHAPERWTKTGFRAATFDGSRLESLNLALGQLERDRVDEFVRRVDDWNYRAASALVAFDLANARAISPRLRLAILTLLGIRRFSRLESVVGAVEDALSLHGGPYARRILEAASADEVTAMALAEPDLVTGWPEFVMAVDVPRDDTGAIAAYALALGSDDEILAWARSNMLACGAWIDGLREILVPLVNDIDESIAWRAVHALSCARDPQTADLLVDVVAGSYPRWVKYGAIQSFLVVLDALPPHQMQERADSFLEAIVALLAEAHFRRAVSRGLSLRGPSRTWCGIALRIIGEVIGCSETLAEHDEWLRLSAAIRVKEHS